MRESLNESLKESLLLTLERGGQPRVVDFLETHWQVVSKVVLLNSMFMVYYFFFDIGFFGGICLVSSLLLAFTAIVKRVEGYLNIKIYVKKSDERSTEAQTTGGGAAQFLFALLNLTSVESVTLVYERIFETLNEAANEFKTIVMLDNKPHTAIVIILLFITNRLLVYCGEFIVFVLLCNALLIHSCGYNTPAFPSSGEILQGIKSTQQRASILVKAVHKKLTDKLPHKPEQTIEEEEEEEEKDAKRK